MARTLYATGGADTYHGEADETTVSYQNAPTGVQAYLSGGGSPTGWAVGDTYFSIENIVGSNFNDYLSGDGRNNKMYGGLGDDTIYGFAGVGSTTYQYGEAGMDTLVGGQGKDILDGGDGEDTVSYFLSTSGVMISLADQSLNTGWAAGDVYTSIQDAIGSNFDDVIYGGREAILNQLQGQDGNDRIFGGAGYNVLIGGAGADQLNGRGTGNLIDYETAKSGVTASMANPSINTGDAAGDTYVNLSNADMAGSPYDDVLYGSDGNNHFIGDPDVNIYKHFGNDRIYGGGGDDILQGDGGADYLDGGAGFDIASYGSASSAVTVVVTDPHASRGDAEGDTYVQIEGYLLSSYDDVFVGDGGVNVVQGMSGNDILYGGGGNDLILGNDGNDTLIAGKGTSRLLGGSGADIFKFTAVGDSISTPQIAPTQIEDFQTGIDKIDISALATTSIDIVQENGFYTLRATAADGTLSVRSTQFFNMNDVLTAQSRTVLQGTAQPDKLVGGVGSDILVGGGGNDDLDGGKGFDTAVYHGLRQHYAVSGTMESRTVTSSLEGTDKLHGIEEIQFTDGRLAFDVDDRAAAVLRMYDAMFGRAPDAPGFEYWTNALQHGTDVQGMSTFFASSSEFVARYGTLSNQGFVEQLYHNVLDRNGEASGVAFWTGELGGGRLTRGQVLAGFSESAEHKESLRPAVEQGLWDLDDTAAQMARVYSAAFDRNPDADGLTFWTDAVKGATQTVSSATDFFVQSAEFNAKYGTLTNAEFVDRLYQNVLDRPGEASGKAFWTNALDTHAMDRGDVLLGFSESAENVASTMPTMANGILLA